MSATGRRPGRPDALLLIAAVAVLASVIAAALTAPVADVDGRARAIEAQLRCPTCQGLSIADSPATSATQMRALVRELLAGGASDNEVRAFFVDRYGRWILLDPPFGGPDLALWFTPVAIVLIGATLVARRARAGVRTELPRRWIARPSGRASTLSTSLIGGAIILALAIPIAGAIGPRLAGREISGGAVLKAAPSIDELEAFVRAEPRDVEALIALGDALFAADRAREAGDRYTAALQIEPDNIAALLGLGAVLLTADRPDAAWPVFDRVLALSPDQPSALLYRGVARQRLEGAATVDVRRDIERFLVIASPDDPRREVASALLQGATASPGRLIPGPQESPKP